MKAFKGLRRRLGVSREPILESISESTSLRTIEDEDRLASEEERQALDEMNKDLQTLVEIFPDVPANSIHRLITDFSTESRLHLITEALLTRRSQFITQKDIDMAEEKRVAVQPRRRSQAGDHGWETVRSRHYKAAVKKALYQEFPVAERYRINRLLSDTNWSYTNTRTVLTNEVQNASGIMAMVSRFRLRRSTGHPTLITWPANETNGVLPTVKPGVQKELARELEATVIEPLKAERDRQRLLRERQIAREQQPQQSSNEDEENDDPTYECQCCFMPTPFEQSTVCSTQDHFICHRCVKFTLSEALYGQSWERSVDLGRGTLQCVALSTGDSCKGWIPREQVQVALSAEDTSKQLMQRFGDELTKRSLMNAGADLLQCPSCPYTEFSLPAKPSGARSEDLSVGESVIVIAAGFVGCACWLTSFFFLRTASVSIHIMFLLFLAMMVYRRHYWWPGWLRRHIRSPTITTKGRKFVCRSPACSETSCLNCLATWKDPHSCFSDVSQSLRTYVEAAVSAAVKRTCPQCRLAFVKASGCNKMMCRCGYSMCYLCKANLTKDKYAHFCNHFRPLGGACSECQKCELYKDIDEQKVIDEARKVAEREWWAQQQEKGLLNGGAKDVALLDRMRATVGNDGGLFQQTRPRDVGLG